ncbi:MAG: class I SAM-dependent methyltransferase [Chlamydiales bacterium]|nr:class I SAM-dependent methyltransferase [Chlamydiales bacterium]
MDQALPENGQPASHFEYVAKVNNRDSNAEIKLHALSLMNQMAGWCSPQKGTILVDMVLKTKPKVIVEIGVYGGKSVIPMAYALKVLREGKIYGIDPWSNFESTQWVQNEENKHFWASVDHEAIMQGLIQKVEQFGLQEQVVLIRNSSMEAPPIENIDILHIDGNHSDETSYFDVLKWVPYVNSGGWIIFDDMTWYENNKYTTARAVEWLDEHCIKFAEFSDSCVWGIWVKP